MLLVAELVAYIASESSATVWMVPSQYDALVQLCAGSIDETIAEVAACEPSTTTLLKGWHKQGP